METKKRDSVSQSLNDLHWLPVKERIQFKVILLTWKALHGEAPSYIEEMLIPKKSARNLRSAQESLLEVPRTNLKTYGDEHLQRVPLNCGILSLNSSRNMTIETHLKPL